jgi:5-methylcytosine-specific restriction endonuclease McrA
MSWENYGKWHIDHVVPDSFFFYQTTRDIGFKKSWELKNLQPLWALDNIKKGGAKNGKVIHLKETKKNGVNNM